MRVKLRENFFDGRQLWRKGVVEFPDGYSVPLPKSAVKIDEKGQPLPAAPEEEVSAGAEIAGAGAPASAMGKADAQLGLPLTVKSKKE